jgi:hypothetical protein
MQKKAFEKWKLQLVRRFRANQGNVRVSTNQKTVITFTDSKSLCMANSNDFGVNQQRAYLFNINTKGTVQENKGELGVGLSSILGL